LPWSVEIWQNPKEVKPKQGRTKAEQQRSKNVTPAKKDFFQLVFLPNFWPLAFEGLNLKWQVVIEAFTLLSACFCVFHVCRNFGCITI